MGFVETVRMPWLLAKELFSALRVHKHFTTGNRSGELRQNHAEISISCWITMIKNSSFKKFLSNLGLSLWL